MFLPSCTTVYNRPSRGAAASGRVTSPIHRRRQHPFDSTQQHDTAGVSGCFHYVAATELPHQTTAFRRLCLDVHRVDGIIGW